MFFSAPTNMLEDLMRGLSQKSTDVIPTLFSVTPEYRLSESYATMARLMIMKKADGAEIKGYAESERKHALQYR